MRMYKESYDRVMKICPSVITQCGTVIWSDYHEKSVKNSKGNTQLTYPWVSLDLLQNIHK